MSRFIAETVSDLRVGRQSWRVLLTLCGSSAILALTAVFTRSL